MDVRIEGSLSEDPIITRHPSSVFAELGLRRRDLIIHRRQLQLCLVIALALCIYHLFVGLDLSLQLGGFGFGVGNGVCTRQAGSRNHNDRAHREEGHSRGKESTASPGAPNASRKPVVLVDVSVDHRALIITFFGRLKEYELI